MTPTKLNKFRRALENRAAELGSGGRHREALAIETSPDELDRIQQAGNHEFTMSNLERNYERLREVRMALRRIAAGTFGICIECEKNINPKRLAAVPWASSCIACQEAPEKAPWTEVHRSLFAAA
jgi:DnaK suppressor protein